jgi:hypothetical protein
MRKNTEIACTAARSRPQHAGAVHHVLGGDVAPLTIGFPVHAGDAAFRLCGDGDLRALDDAPRPRAPLASAIASLSQ